MKIMAATQSSVCLSYEVAGNRCDGLHPGNRVLLYNQ